MDVYTIAAIKHATTVIKGIQNYTLNPQVAAILLSGSGGVDAGFSAIGEIRPELGFETTAIKTALANLGGINGIPIAASNFDFWLQKTITGALRAGATSHIKCTPVAGIVVPGVISMPSGRQASISYRAGFISADGVASPIAVTASQSLDAGQGPADEAWTFGGVAVNGSALAGVDDVTLDFGIELWVTTADGKVYPIHVCIASRRPVITISTKDLGAFQTWGVSGSNWLEGQVQSESDSVITLSDMTEGGVRGSSPITFTIDAGMMFFNAITGQDGERLGGQVTLIPTWDGTADVIVMSGLV